MKKRKFLFLALPLLLLALLLAACPEEVAEENDEDEEGAVTSSIQRANITQHPTSADYVTGDTIAALVVKADPSAGGTLSYKWYKVDTYTNSGGEAVGENSASYTPEVAVGATAYYYVAVSNSGSSTWTQASNPARIRMLAEAPAAPAVSVDIQTTSQQYVRGFGGMSNGFGIGAPARYMELRDINTMFNPETGLGLKILRIMIWPDPLEDVVSGKVEPQMNNQLTYIEAVKRVNKYGGYVLASPWSPPPQWKVNESINGTSPSYLLPQYYSTYAAYLKNYATEMANTYGAPIYTLSIQNEPSWPASYAGCEWSSQQQVDFFTASGVGKFLSGAPGWGAGEEGQVKIMSGEAHQNVTWNNAARDNTTANAAIDIYAYHTYGNHSNSYTAVQADSANMRKEVWMTEYNINSGEGNFAQDSTWNFVWPFTVCLDNDIRCDNANAFVWWYAKRFYSFIGDNSNGTVNGEVQPRGYIISHYAKYATDTVRVGAFVTGHPAKGNTSDLSSTGYASSDVKVKASAFRRKANPTSYWEKIVQKQEDSISVVIFDQRTDGGDGADIRIKLPADFGAATGVSAIISDSTGNRHAPLLITLNRDGKGADFNLPSNAIVSVKFTK